MNALTTSQILKPKPSRGPIYRSLLVWGLTLGLTVTAILALRAPAPIAAGAPPTVFSAERALVHMRTIASAPHPIGSSQNEMVRNYLVTQLSSLGFDPQVFRAIGAYTSKWNISLGDTYDVVGRLRGTGNSRAIMLMAHYDSVSQAPGAADDGTGVAAILEAARALRAGPALKNDVIILFTDGEEAGLLGADAFAASHPWVHDVGLIMNFDARGTRGPSLLFETGANNAALIKVIRKASYPVGSSLFYSLYKLLPNDTDFTVFRQRNIPGLNFAFGENLEAYHSRLDGLAALSPASLQHHGSYALDLTRQFGDMNLTDLASPRGDYVFFDWFGRHFIAYPQSWVIPGEILVTMGLFVLVILSVRRGEAKKSALPFAALFSLILVAAVPAILAAAYWLVARVLAGRMIIADSGPNSFLLTGFVLLGVSGGTWLFALCRRRFNIRELSLAGLIVGCLLSWVFAVLLPAGSYVLFWPLSLGVMALLAAAVIKTFNNAAESAAAFIGMAATILLFAPIVYLLYIFLTLQLATVLAAGLLVGLAFILCGPFLDLAIHHNAWRAICLAFATSALLSIMVGIISSTPSPSHPRRDSIVYSLNADDHRAAWISYDKSTDAWTSKRFDDKKPSHTPVPDYLGGFMGPVLFSPTPAQELKPPAVKIEADQREDGLRRINMKITSGRNAERIFMIFANGTHPVSLDIGGRVLPFAHAFGPESVSFYGMGIEGAQVEITFTSSSKVSFWLMDEKSGLPVPTDLRPDDVIAGNRSDITLVCRKYNL